MTTFFHALAAEHLVLAAVVLLMALEIARASDRFARAAYLVPVLAAFAVLATQAVLGFTADPVPGEVRIDRFAVYGRLALVGLALVLALAFPARESAKHWMLAALSLLGGMAMLASAGFATFFLGLELLSLPAFALLVHGRGQSTAPEGAFKYLVLSSVASALLLFGVSLAYGATGTLSIASWARQLGEGAPMARAAALLVLCGLFLKAAVFPFHAWAPDAYAAARLPVMALLAALVKAAIVLALARIVGDTALDAGAAVLVATLALASIFFGNFAALRQPGLRRMLAYSSVAHAGYMIVALLDTTGHRGDDLLVYATVYALGTIATCAAYAAIHPGEDDPLAALDGAFSRHPGASLLFALGLLSLAGLPPFPGFFAKLTVFRSVVASGHLALAVIAFAGSFVGLAYYLGAALRPFRERPGAALTGDSP